jgi:gas vesicle protein
MSWAIPFLIGLFLGAIVGTFAMAMIAAGHHEDECRRCAVRDVESYGGSE